MNTKDLEILVKNHGLAKHLYPDDTQVYFSFDVNCANPDFSQINACFLDIKKWMALNFLKLNEEKTEVIELGLYESYISTVALGDSSVQLSERAKNLGFHFDDQMSLSHQVNAITQKCFMNLRDLKRIGSKLTHDLKIQLVHSLIFSHLDYCNSVFGGLSEANLNKLQKVQYNAVRFIYGLKGKDRRQSLSPYLKKLHFLPIRYRIKYKIALLVFKCLNNIAPRYLSDLITLRDPNNHSLRLDNDFYVLKSPPHPNLKRNAGAFNIIAPHIWNNLPYQIRCFSDFNGFKKMLKTHFFNIAFSDTEEVVK